MVSGWVRWEYEGGTHFVNEVVSLLGFLDYERYVGDVFGPLWALLASEFESN